MFPVIRIDAVRSEDDLPIALISVDRRHTDAGMGIDARQDQSIRPEIGKNLIKRGAVERAVAFLDEDDV